ncbi:uncharacterized protein C2845_PM11G19280 [Panicum miliaceum]|uniref:RING-type E3 ubiquitin transferase n=1 Tax=Panicum miliaceum TaxID=4540 RepID=A0A3L6RVE4_PANMI|nr:uncharacterized protein C2845_PM11G19280 [Panicum miliaceum]
MTSTSARSDGAYFDTVRLVSQLAGGYDSGYQFQPEDAALDAVAWCSDDPLFRDGDAMDLEHLNRGGSLCDTVYQSAPAHQLMEVIPNWNCKGTDAFCSQVGPFEASRPVTRAMQDVAFTRSGITVQGLQCKPASSTDGAAAARVAAVFRYVPPWEDQPTAARRTGLSAMTLSAEGVWKLPPISAAISGVHGTAYRKNFVSPSPLMSLEGVYNPEDGRMYLIGCRNVHAPWRVLSKRRDLEDGMDCCIEMTVEYPPTTTRWLISRAVKVSVASTRGEDDPLHFNRTDLRSLPVAYRDQRHDELTEPVVEGLLCVTVLSATIVATPGQLRYVKSHADVAPYVSLTTLGVQALGYSATLIADARTLPAWPTRGYMPYYAGHLGWSMDRSVKALTLATLLLTVRLAQVVSRSRARARAQSPLEPGRVPGDGAVLLCSAGVHLVGLLFVLAVHWLSTYGTPTADQPPSGVVYGEAQGMPSPARVRVAIVERYAGVAKEWFLLPQVVGNALWRVNCKPLAARYYAGVTAVWLLPHVYGYLRPPVVNTNSEAAHGDAMGFYSKAGAVVVPVVGFVLALVVYVQQRWNYKIVGWAMRRRGASVTGRSRSK